MHKVKKTDVRGFISLKPNRMNELSLEAYGVLSTMINIPEADYKTFEELKDNFFAKDSEKTLKLAISELINSGYLFIINNEIFVVNKSMLPDMKVIVSKKYGGDCSNGSY